MILIVPGISVSAAVSGVLFITYWKFDGKKDYLYDETESLQFQPASISWRMMALS
jgi:hypothetical protein